MRLALIGDIHVFSLHVHPRRLMSRRIMAQSNLWLNRRFRFNHAMLLPLIAQVRATAPDLLLCSGDVTTTSLENEFLDVVNHLRPLANEVPTLIVPGNHDRYTFKSQRKKRMEEVLEGLMPQTFPHHRVLSDRWHLIALDSGIPNLVMSRGALGKPQLEALSNLLANIPQEHGIVVLCHYPAATPPGVPSSWSHNLREDVAVRQLLTGTPQRVLYLHGHIHKPWYWASGEGVGPADQPALAYLNAGSPCMTSNTYPLGQGFWQIELPDDPARDVGLIHQIPHNSTYGSGRMKRITAARAGTGLRWEAHQVL